MLTPKNKYRYTITDRFGPLIVLPVGESDFSIEWEQDNEDGKRTYDRKFAGNVIFTGEAFTRLFRTERSIYRCEYQTIKIEKKCVDDGEAIWSDLFNGRISLNNGEWDLDRCNVKIKFDEIKPHQCFEDNKTTKLDLMDVIASRRTVKLGETVVELEYKECKIDPAPLAVFEFNMWCEEGTTPEDGKWGAFRKTYDRTSPATSDQSTWWVREVTTVTCPADPGEEWVMVEDNCALDGTSKWARFATIYDCVYSRDWVYECQVLNSGTDITFDNGLPFDEVIVAFVNAFCPGLTVRSNFFQINPYVTSTTNYVTGLASKVLLLTLFQKSDIKRPLAGENATKAEWEFGKLMAALYTMFKVQWDIVEDDFILEHYSYFEASDGLILTADKYKKYVDGKRKYTYKTEEIPQQEIWKWKEQRAFGDFPGLPIIYDGACVAMENKSNIKTYTVDDVMTDVEYAMVNSGSDSSKVSDDGFVIVAAYLSGFDYYILKEASILEPFQRANNTLAWAQLMRDYHRYGRPLSSGNMNNEFTSFYSTIPTKKGEKLVIPLCCWDEFNPGDFVTTPLGMGFVEKAVFKMKTSMLELDLLYSAVAFLVGNIIPTANNDTVDTTINTPVDIHVLDNDTDTDVDGEGETLTPHIVSPPMHGTAVVTVYFTIMYTPDPGYTGNDNFTYLVKDKWGESSNDALVSITINP